MYTTVQEWKGVVQSGTLFKVNVLSIHTTFFFKQFQFRRLQTLDAVSMPSRAVHAGVNAVWTEQTQGSLQALVECVEKAETSTCAGLRNSWGTRR